MSKNKRPNNQRSEIKEKQVIEQVQEEQVESIEEVQEEQVESIEEVPEEPAIDFIEKKTKCRVNLRSGASKDSEVIMVLEEGTIVKGIDLGDWFNIAIISKEKVPGVIFEQTTAGFIMSEFLK